MNKTWTPAGIASEQIVVLSPDTCGNCGVLQRKLDAMQTEFEAAKKELAKWRDELGWSEDIGGRGFVAKPEAVTTEWRKMKAELEAARAEIEQLRWRVANNIGITTKETGDLTLQEGLAEIVIRRAENKKLESELEAANEEIQEVLDKGRVEANAMEQVAGGGHTPTRFAK